MIHAIIMGINEGTEHNTEENIEDSSDQFPFPSDGEDDH
jgi:hypothetical protein